jgi:hypothetical protein
MFLGWYDPDKKKPARRKLEDAVERYVEKFGGEPITCLASSVDAEELATDGKAPAIDVRAVAFVPRFTFYVGIDDAPPDVAEAA